MSCTDICKHAGLCGGCKYQGIPYPDQLSAKDEALTAELEKWGVVPVVRDAIVPSPDKTGYRNKMEYTFGDLEKGGPMTLGLHKRGSFMSVVTVDQCQLVPPDFNQILAATLEFCQGYPKYHKKTHEGMLRNLILRRGVRTGEVLINLVTTSMPGFDKAGFTDMLRQLPLQDAIAGILLTVNDGISDAVRCDSLEVLFGRDSYQENILGLQFSVSAFSFFQANVPAVEALYREAILGVPDLQGKTVYDLFCGTGTISQALALKADKVVGIELVPESVASARENAALNHIENCTFVAGDVFEILADKAGDLPTPDLVVVDPPRAGVSDKALRKIIDYGVNEIVYISCNPVSLAKNLAAFQEGGYRATYMRAYDNFPFTAHTEALCFLKHEEP